VQPQLLSLATHIISPKRQGAEAGCRGRVQRQGAEISSLVGREPFRSQRAGPQTTSRRCNSKYRGSSLLSWFTISRTAIRERTSNTTTPQRRDYHQQNVKNIAEPDSDPLTMAVRIRLGNQIESRLPIGVFPDRKSCRETRVQRHGAEAGADTFSIWSLFELL
jgi:ribosomal protein S14